MLEIKPLHFFIILFVSWFLFRVVINVGRKKPNITREVILNIFFVYIIGLITVTFFDFRVYLTQWRFSANLTPMTETIAMLKGARIEISLMNIFGNLIMLVPLGFLLPMLNSQFRNLKNVLIAGFLVSLSIEILQYIMMVRLFDIDDLIFNTISVAIGYSAYIVSMKSQYVKLLQASAESTMNRNPIFTVSLPIIVISLIFGTLWFSEYFDATYPLDKKSENSIFQFVTGHNVKEYSGNRYHIVISENTKDNSIKDVNIFVKTPFGRAVPYITDTIIEPNNFGNSVSFVGHSTIDDKMFYMFYGNNTTGDYITLKVGGDQHQQSIEKGYFINVFIVDSLESLTNSFSNKKGVDVTNEFILSSK